MRKAQPIQAAHPGLVNTTEVLLLFSTGLAKTGRLLEASSLRDSKNSSQYQAEVVF